MVTTALAHNFDLRIAVERVQQARAQLGIASANKYPFVDIGGFHRGA
jgi:outer membrane protein TolC